MLALAEGSPLAFMVETGAGDVDLANDAFCRLLALDSAAQSLTGMAVRDVLQRSPRVTAQALMRLQSSDDSASTLPLDESPDGAALERHPIAVEGESTGAVWIARDAAQGDRVVDRGVAEVALIEKIGEELSVALEGLSLLSIRAQQRDFDSALVEHLQRIRTSTETAMTAIGDLVDFSRVSGGVVLHKAPFRLRPALAELVARVAANAEEHDCRLRVKVEQDVSDALEGDVERLLLVLKNLLDNAFTLLPGAEILLQITPEYMTETGIQLSFAVVASGPAVQAFAATSSAETGMGVAVAKFMVVAMGGTLAVAARGSADALYGFTIEFPVRPTPAPPARASYASLASMSVLVVSNDPAQRDHLANILRGWRMLPLEADNASMAMALLERMQEENQPVPLVMLANRLPVQDGFLLAFRIKHHPRLQATLVMMLATEGKPGDAIACRENGISAYMRYPVAPRQLNEAIVAVTGASVDADETPTLVTRHSLREQRKGATVLLVDRSRDSQILAAHILGRADCSVVVAQDAAEAFAALEQDLYDVVLVETSLAALGDVDGVKSLRARLTRDPEATRFIAVSVEHSPAYRERMLAAGFDATLGKPFRKDDLLALVQGQATPA
jgi:CheY-like chemotaxis protein